MGENDTWKYTATQEEVKEEKICGEEMEEMEKIRTEWTKHTTQSEKEGETLKKEENEKTKGSKA